MQLEPSALSQIQNYDFVLDVSNFGEKLMALNLLVLLLPTEHRDTLKVRLEKRIAGIEA